MRFQHEDRIRGLKTQFLRDKRAFEDATEDRIRAEAQRANKVIHVPLAVMPSCIFYS